MKSALWNRYSWKRAPGRRVRVAEMRSAMEFVGMWAWGGEGTNTPGKEGMLEEGGVGGWRVEEEHMSTVWPHRISLTASCRGPYWISASAGR
jgi:hypothetical protein